MLTCGVISQRQPAKDGKHPSPKSHTLSAAFPSALDFQPLLICTFSSLGKKVRCVQRKSLKYHGIPPRRTRDALKLCLVPQYPCPCSPRGGRGVDDSVSRAHILRDHCYCEAVHTSATEQSKLDLGGDSLQERGRVGVCKLTPTCGQAWEPPRRLRSGLPPDQRKEGTNAPVPFSVFLCP